MDEIWSFCHAHKKNLPEKLAGRPGYGDVWNWIALCPDTKAVVCWRIGGRDEETGAPFLRDLATRLAYPVHLSTDGLPIYRDVVPQVFDLGRVHFTQTVKDYRAKHIRGRVSGPGDPDYASTSLIERLNLTLRMQLRRYTRLTNGHSKNLDHHAAQVALFFLFYNFVRPHESLANRTPAQMLGLTKGAWSLAGMLDMLEDTDGQI